MKNIPIKDSDAELKQLEWKKIIQEYQNSGQSQSSFCRQRKISRLQFIYQLRRWRKENLKKEKTTFLPMEVEMELEKNNDPDIKLTHKNIWLLNINEKVTLKLPAELSMEEIAQFILILRRDLC
jgi:hypothetical protein